MSRKPPKRVVVLGGGFAGLYASTYLATSELSENAIDITLISENNYFTFLPLLPEVVAGALGRADVVFPYRVYAVRYGFRFLQSKVVGIDLKKRIVQCSRGLIAFDYLVLALGSKPKYFGNDALERHCMPLTTVAEAEAIRDRVIRSAELAASENNEAVRQRLLTFAVAGAGPAGVEVAGEIWNLLHTLLPRYFGVATRPRIIIYQGGERILLGWDESLAGQGLELLRKRGIEVNLNTRVKSYDGKSVTAFSGEQDHSVETGTLIWTAGTAPSTELLTASGLKFERSGHIIIDEFLRVAGSENVFSVGDMTSLVAERTGRLYPPVAPIAISQGIRAAANIENLIMGRSLEPYRAHHAGKIVSLGGGVALVDLFGWHITGRMAWIIYRTIYLLKLVGAKNKIRAMVSLTLSHFFEPDITCDKG
jgi:NADH dehydrogenase